MEHPVIGNQPKEQSFIVTAAQANTPHLYAGYNIYFKKKTFQLVELSRSY